MISGPSVHVIMTMLHLTSVQSALVGININLIDSVKVQVGSQPLNIA